MKNLYWLKNIKTGKLVGNNRVANSATGKIEKCNEFPIPLPTRQTAEGLCGKGEVVVKVALVEVP